MRGPYGNGFDIENFKGKEIVVVAGGTGLSPVRELWDYFAGVRRKPSALTLIAGFKSPQDILFRKDFEQWEKRIHVIRTVDSAPEGYEGLTGMVTKYILIFP